MPAGGVAIATGNAPVQIARPPTRGIGVVCSVRALGCASGSRAANRRSIASAIAAIVADATQSAIAPAALGGSIKAIRRGFADHSGAARRFDAGIRIAGTFSKIDGDAPKRRNNRQIATFHGRSWGCRRVSMVLMKCRRHGRTHLRHPVLSRFSNSETALRRRFGQFVGLRSGPLAQWLQLLDIPEKVPMASAGVSARLLANFIR
jgi:hypothetical protein